jgi:hypothetical protein
MNDQNTPKNTIPDDEPLGNVQQDQVVRNDWPFPAGEPKGMFFWWEFVTVKGVPKFHFSF